jgi:hypothetical protein
MKNIIHSIINFFKTIFGQDIKLNVNNNSKYNVNKNKKCNIIINDRSDSNDK